MSTTGLRPRVRVRVTVTVRVRVTVTVRVKTVELFVRNGRTRRRKSLL